MNNKLKVMLICPALPEGIGKYFNVKDETGAGWVQGLVSELKSNQNIDLIYSVFSESKTYSIIKKEIENINYIYVNYPKNYDLKPFFSTINCDIYHLFGAENSYSYKVFSCLPVEKTLVYIQGIVSECAHHYKANYNQYHKSGYLLDKYMDMNVKIFNNRASDELKIFKQCKYVAGRTEWDKAFIYKLNCNIKYYHLDESLRDIFYSANKWNINDMNSHTIYVTQAGYPLKAAHMILEIINILKDHYPDIKCLISGEDLMHSNGIATKLGVSYASYIQKIIQEYRLANYVQFVGNKYSNEVVNLLLKTNVFLLSSSIENSSNSLQEAMLLGVPSVSSDVGGIESLIGNSKSVETYPFDDPMLAAYKISKIFDDKEYAEKLSKNAIKRAEYLTDRKKNGEEAYHIYLDMLENK